MSMDHDFEPADRADEMRIVARLMRAAWKDRRYELEAEEQRVRAPARIAASKELLARTKPRPPF